MDVDQWPPPHICTYTHSHPRDSPIGLTLFGENESDLVSLFITLAATPSNVCLQSVLADPYEHRVTTDLMSETTHVLNFGDNIL